MKTARSEMTIFFDVDDTLIMWDGNHHQKTEGKIGILDPNDGMTTYHRQHKRHIDFLKKQYAKGYTVVVWSAGGTLWASAVVQALELEEYVDYAVAKPLKWVDDLSDPAQILGVHIYLDEEGHST